MNRQKWRRFCHHSLLDLSILLWQLAIEEAHDLFETSVDELFGALQAHEQCKNEKKVEKPIEQALQAQVSIKGEQKCETIEKHGSSRGRV